MNTWGASATATAPLAKPLMTRPDARPSSAVDRAASLSLEAGLLERIGGLVGVSGADLRTARGLLNLLGDPGRRTVLERLARQPDRPGRTLPDVTGMDHPDLYHRVRSLSHCGFVAKNRHHIYSVDAGALACASRYADLLALAASLTVREPPR